MNILVCYKIVPDEQDIVVKPDQTLSFDRAELKIGQYDLNAVEAGVQLVEAAGGAVTALTVGGAEVDNSKMKKSILSRGPGSNLAVKDDSLAGADSATTAKALAAAQFAQYGMPSAPAEMLENFAKQIMENKEQQSKVYEKLYEVKVVEYLKSQIKVSEKSISADDFAKLAKEVA